MEGRGRSENGRGEDEWRRGGVGEREVVWGAFRKAASVGKLEAPENLAKLARKVDFAQTGDDQTAAPVEVKGRASWL